MSSTTPSFTIGLEEEYLLVDRETRDGLGRQGDHEAEEAHGRGRERSGAPATAPRPRDVLRAEVRGDLAHAVGELAWPVQGVPGRDRLEQVLSVVEPAAVSFHKGLAQQTNGQA